MLFRSEKAAPKRWGTLSEINKEVGDYFSQAYPIVLQRKDGTSEVYMEEDIKRIAKGMSESVADAVDRIAGEQKRKPSMRKFETGATRNCDQNKYDYEGFFTPLFIEAFGAYMHKHRVQIDGALRDSDNWQKGLPLDVCIKSAWRHFFDLWKIHRGIKAISPEDGHEIDAVEACCALFFNVQAYVHETLKKKI